MSNTIFTRLPVRRWRPTAVVAGLAAIVLLAGCSSGGGPAPTDGSGIGSDPNATGSTWADIQKRGTINIGVGLTTPPFGVTDKNGQPSGYDVDVAQELADFLGVKANIFEVSADARIPTLQSGKADIISFTLTQTPERDQQVDFSTATMNTYQGVAVLKSSSIQSLDELGDKTLSAQKGALGATVAAKAFPNAPLQQYDTAVATRLAVEQGQADAIVDSISVLSYAISNGGDTLRIVPGVVGSEVQHFGLGIQKGNSTLKEKVDEFLAQFHAKGKGKTLYKKWFGSDAPNDVFQGLEN